MFLCGELTWVEDENGDTVVTVELDKYPYPLTFMLEDTDGERIGLPATRDTPSCATAVYLIP